MKKGEYVRLTKISDDRFKGNHPNGIFEGYTQYGVVVDDIKIGERFNVMGNHLTDYLSTSSVIEIIDDTTFKTKNSTYRVEKFEESEYFLICEKEKSRINNTLL